MISLILLKLFTFSQILQGVPKLLHATVYCIDCMSWSLYPRPASKWRHPESHVCAVWWCYWTDLSGGFHMPCHAFELHGQWVGLQCTGQKLYRKFLFNPFMLLSYKLLGIMFWIDHIWKVFILFIRNIPETVWKWKDNSWWKWGNPGVNI